MDAWINEPPSDSESEDEKPKAIFHDEKQTHGKSSRPEIDEEELARRRAARKEEQANNPFYIKSSPSPHKLYQDSPGVDHIPVVQIDLSVPLKVPGLPNSDQYVKLEEERRTKQRQEKDKKKKKDKDKKSGKTRRHKSVHTESDEDIAPAHHVDIITEEMPENALPSDDDDKDPNDPYRALDIDLDKPLADTEKLPVQRHRNTDGLKSPDNDASTLDQKVKKPSKKEKRQPESERVKKKEKKKSKEKEEKTKRKKSTTKEAREDEAEGKDEAGKSQEKTPADFLIVVTHCLLSCQDMDFWLAGSQMPPEEQDPAAQSLPEVITTEQEPEELTKTEVQEERNEEEPEKQKSHRHKKKHKKDKDEPKEDKKSRKKKHHHHHHRHESHADDHSESVHNGTLDDEEPLPPMSSYKLLAENKYIKMMYDIQGDLQKESQVTVSIILENQSECFLKSMELNVLDSLNTKMQRPEGSSVHDGIPIPFQLPPGVSNEAQFVFTVQSIVMPQKLKGTLAFIVKDDEGSSHEKLDFKINFSCSSYLIMTPCYSDAFAKLLESGDLKMSSLKVENTSLSFHHLLAKICFYHHFTVVERVDSCASMYSRSIQGHHTCLLVKKGDQSISIDGKCSEATLLSSLLSELKATLSES
uniref:AP-3 complex subunit delta-1 n=1 Tax=Engystomops pustulosus TaxID=76066 RepID=A0AAV6Z7H5_ENGPU|nr:hypothetical protein GDO81_024911 [Engystomops pustulosus]